MTFATFFAPFDVDSICKYANESFADEQTSVEFYFERDDERMRVYIDAKTFFEEEGPVKPESYINYLVVHDENDTFLGNLDETAWWFENAPSFVHQIY